VPVAAGTLVWRHTPPGDVTVRRDDFAVLNDDQRIEMLWFGFVDAYDGRWHLDGDDLRFINHSAEPNIAFTCPIGEHGREGVALIDIPANTELVTDYSSFSRYFGVRFHGDKNLNLGEFVHPWVSCKNNQESVELIVERQLPARTLLYSPRVPSDQEIDGDTIPGVISSSVAMPGDRFRYMAR
jgi:hypothetical protein